jgi:hypothetical protein
MAVAEMRIDLLTGQTVELVVCENAGAPSRARPYIDASTPLDSASRSKPGTGGKFHDNGAWARTLIGYDLG